MPPTTSHQTDQPIWARFSLGDALVIVLCISAATYWGCHLNLKQQHLERSVEIQLLAIGLTGLIDGLSLAGPFILFGQFLRGRPIPPRPGEWLWISPCLLLLIGIATGTLLMLLNLRLPISFLFVFVAVLQSLLVVASIIALFLFFEGEQTWSERLGSLSCLLFTVFWLILSLYFFPPLL